ncbi:MAG TPA: TonB-dependent receptor [Pyrinomonadaceae bacterium]|nr:TonB-dependent receptor [Pyrinomonadaceae bacterium]
MRILRSILLTGLFALLLNVPGIAQQNGSLAGQVTDSLGAIVVGASVTIVTPTGTERNTTTNSSGEYTVTGLAPGKYTVRVSASKFALYENTEVEIAAGRRTELIAVLTVEGLQEEVEISSDGGVSTDPSNNAGATVLKEKDLESLPDDPDELEAALQALAGPAAGPGGGQIYIDGFMGGQLPPKEAIREIRINNNPFSAEFDRLGFGRIEILTKPGADTWRGSAFGNFNDARLNSRNPFAVNRAPSQLKVFGGNVSGPIVRGKSSFFIDVNNRWVDNNSIVNALILDQSLNPQPFQQEFQLPTRRLSISPRFDYAINDKNTLVARYSYTRTTSENQGIGNLSLPSRGFNSESVGHELRLTETMIINPKTINETRLSLEWNDRDQTGDNSIPTINVADAFTGGGSQIGLSYNRNRIWELQNYTTTSLGAAADHTLKFGVRVRSISINDRSESNYGGSFVFAGAPELRNPVGCTPVGPGCTVVAPALTPLEQYRGRLLNLNDPRYFPTQFNVTTGTPLQKVSRTDYSLFVTDDWRVNQGLTLSFGLRYENQTNISDNWNFAPRFSFAWSPGAGGARAPKTVFRGGVGIFYDRFSENLTLQALRFNGTSQLSLSVSANDPDPVRRAAAIALLQQPIFTLTGVTNVPTAAQILAVLPQSNTIRQVSPDIKSPMMIQGAFGVERQLPARTTMGAFFVTSRTTNVLRSRNINAPICPEQINCLNAPRPEPTLGNINEFESTGTLDQNRLNINFRNMYNRNFTVFANYSLGFSNSDTDGAGSFPAYSYDLSDEYGRSLFDIRHNFVIGGNFTLPYQFTLSPFIIANGGRPFNITRGLDLNGDLLFTERPTFAQLAAACSSRGVTASYCDVAGQDPNAIIPRNYGEGPGSFTVNLRVGRNFGFGKAPERGGVASNQGGPQRGGQGGMGGFGGGRGGGRPGGGGGFGGGEGRKPYNLNLTVNFQNLLNNVNLGTPIGNIASSRFGQSTSTAGSFGGFGGGGGGGFGGGGSTANRRIELQARFSW